MKLVRIYNSDLEKRIKTDLLAFAQLFKFASILDSNGFSSGSSSYDLIAGFSNTAFEGSFKDASTLIDNSDQWTFLATAYDIKNELEELTSRHESSLEFQNVSYFHPELLILQSEQGMELYYTSEEILGLFNPIESKELNYSELNLQSRISQKEYIETIEEVKLEIARGNVYEINFCQEYYQEGVKLNPYLLFDSLKENAPTPFSSFVKFKDKFIISASPERYLKKEGKRLISQPIKGTIRRGANAEEDKQLIQKLRNDKKEQNENVMIVDLVRNDLSRIAISSSVQVKELFGIYSFPQVHQMISTITCEIEVDLKFSEILKETFPMGSMTGAPKLSAMKLIDQKEKFKREMYSGSIGYIKPNGDFDLNVVIRSILYNSNNKYLSYSVGGAITYMCDPLFEFEECQLKAQAMKLILEKYEKAVSK